MQKIDLIVKNRGEENPTPINAQLFNSLISKINECVEEINKLQKEIENLKKGK